MSPSSTAVDGRRRRPRGAGWLGHASVTTGRVYTPVTDDNLREVFATAQPPARD